MTTTNTPKISIIIPTIDGDRDGMLPNLLEQIKEQTYKNCEVILKVGDNRQGRAINNGAKEATGKYIVIMDDDIILGDSDVLEKLVHVAEEDKAIGMAGASLAVWDKANWIQKRVMLEIPRYTSPIVETVTESDFVCHGCCILPKEVFFEVGAEREEIIRGLDPDLRVRLRNAGYKIVLVPNTHFYHLPPKTFGKIIRKFFRNGMGSSYIQLFYPQYLYETDSGRGDFIVKRKFLYRILRYPLRVLDHLLHFRFVAFCTSLSYLFGFIYGYITYGIKGNPDTTR
ncbi:MAG: glycosyltransferase [Candidatus Ancaeobacter aquaticus]|nr:glycosyltransferase [Candidatus Ancaeobacter aquaticus]